MANVINQINVGGTTYDVGAAAANVSVNPANAGVKSTLLEPALKEIPDNTINKYNANNLADNLTTGTAGTKALDAHQGSVLQTQTNNIMDIVYGKTTRAYAAGDFFMLNNKPYCASTAIAAGTTLTDSTVTSYATLLSESATNVLAGQIASINNTLSSHGTTLYGKPFENVRWSGENLGSTFTAEQLAYIQHDEGYQLGLGSYWTDEAQGIRWRNLDFNFLLHKGDSLLRKYHSLVMPDTCLLKGGNYMQDSNVHATANGYNGTKYRSTYRSQCKTKFDNFFGSHVLTHRESLTNASTNGQASGWSWYDCDVELPSEDMIYGSSPWGNSTYGGGSGYNVGITYGRIAGFESHPELINTPQSYWLRTICTDSDFARVGGYGSSDHGVVSNCGLRPYALIG